ncbi:hypothetical protein EBB07_18290 [Paenibacillaceae bacterium]|nr:hypothetical protein EBB07_18290 [Paenibacillaceae bacterium]
MYRKQGPTASFVLPEKTKMPAAAAAGIKEIYFIKGGHTNSIEGEDECNLRLTLQNDYKMNSNVTKASATYVI